MMTTLAYWASLPTVALSIAVYVAACGLAGDIVKRNKVTPPHAKVAGPREKSQASVTMRL